MHWHIKPNAIRKSLLNIADSYLAKFSFKEKRPQNITVPRHKKSSTSALRCTCVTVTLVWKGVTIITVGLVVWRMKWKISAEQNRCHTQHVGRGTIKTNERHLVHKSTLCNTYRSSARNMAEAFWLVGYLWCLWGWFSKCWKHFLPLRTQLRTTLFLLPSWGEPREGWVNHKSRILPET